MAHLKPCPFCGGEAFFSRVPGGGHSILCRQCGAVAMLGRAGGRDELGTAWNRRKVRHNFQFTIKLEPCPFCASRMDIGTADAAGSILRCNNCGMMISFVDSDNMKTSISKWNRREGPAQ